MPVLIGAAAFDETENQRVFFVLDLTERKRADQTLRERDAKIQGMIDAKIIGIFIATIDEQMIEANDAFLHMLGYDREDLAADHIHWKRMTPTEWRCRAVQTRAELEKFGTVQPFEKEYFRRRQPHSRAGRSGGARTRTRRRLRARSDRAASGRKPKPARASGDTARCRWSWRTRTASRRWGSSPPRSPMRSTSRSPRRRPMPRPRLRWLGAQPPDLEEARQTLGRIVRERQSSRRRHRPDPRPHQEGAAAEGRLDINEVIREVIELTRGEAVKNGVSVQTRLAEACRSFKAIGSNCNK